LQSKSFDFRVKSPHIWRVPSAALRIIEQTKPRAIMIENVRDLGPVVKLARPDVYALSRFDDVRDGLTFAKADLAAARYGNGRSGLQTNRACTRLRSAVIFKS